MKKFVPIVMFLMLPMLFAQIGLCYGTPIFSDDFQSGNLDNWVIGGRQKGTNTANVVSFGGSLAGHLYHSSFTEITMYKDFQFDEFDVTDSFSFDLAVRVSSQSPPSSQYYSWAGVSFRFLDTNSETLGVVHYGVATTNYPFSRWASKDYIAGNQISQGSMGHYDLSISNLLSQVMFDQTQIAALRMEGKTYGSTYPYPRVSAELWIDNVSTVPTTSTDPVPEPATMLLFCTGLVGFAGTRIRKRFKK